MNRRRLLVLLVILGLLTGLIGPVGVAWATGWSFTPSWGNVVYQGSGYVAFMGTGVGDVWTGYYVNTNPASGYAQYGTSAFNGGYTFNFAVDGVEKGENAGPYYASCTFIAENSGKAVVDMKMTFLPAAGSHDYSWYISGVLWYPTEDAGKSLLYIGSVEGYDTSVWGGGYPGEPGEPGPGVWPSPEYVPPLSVTIDSGPTAVDLIDGGTWHALATGGHPGYTYAWGYHPIGQGGYFDAWPYAGQSFTHVFTAGIWIIQVQATDTLGAKAYYDITVTAATIAGAYQAHLTRSGPLGQYVSINVTDAAGDPVTISSTAGTQYGLYEAGGAFGWYAADSEASQLGGGSYTWRWTMSYTITPPGLPIVPPPDFWFQSSVHLAIPNLNLLVSHHFTGISENVEPWFPPGPPGTDVPPVIPETPPSPTSTLPDWLAPLWDFLVKLFKALFQPDATDFSKQLSGSWVTIASPVPSITPQYTIPFPNPSHLLAPTGDSVDISFAGVMSYSGYSTYKAIVQALLDAILVFVVISIIT